MGIRTHYFGEFKKCLGIVSKASRKKIIKLTALQCVISILDLFAVLIIAGISAIAVRGYSSQPTGSQVSSLLKFLHLSSFNYEKQISILLLIAVGFLTFKTLFSMSAAKKILRVLSHVSTELSLGALKSNLEDSSNLEDRADVTKIHFSLTQGVNSIVFGVIGASVLLVSDFFLLLLIIVGLILIDPTVAISVGLLFSGVGILVTRNSRGKAKLVGNHLANFHTETQLLVSGLFNNLLEVRLRGTQQYFFNKFGSIRSNYESDFVLQGYLPNVGKYYVEMTVILGTVGVAFSQFLLNDLAHATASLAVFLASTSRIAPALLRIHQNSVQIQISLGTAARTLNTTIFSSEHRFPISEEKTPSFFAPPELELREVTYRHKPGQVTLNKINMKVEPGSFVAIVGPSGSGKTTLLNLMIGALDPQHGKILVGNCNPSDFARRNPGAIGYVAQEIFVYTGGLRENILLGLNEQDVGLKLDELIDQTLLNHLDNYDLALNPLSGGEKQRLGLARALVTQPRLLILDEPTSALDAQSEKVISTLLSDLKGSTTLVLVAHRLSTVLQADEIYYLDKGKILGNGTFNELRERISDFDQQAELMGF
jgi:ATP-binding cassette subfamily C protein